MRVEDRRRANNFYFREIAEGEVFQCDTPYFFMKVEEIEATGGRAFNAVSLNSGALVYFRDDTEISEPLNAKIVIENFRG